MFGFVSNTDIVRLYVVSVRCSDRCRVSVRFVMFSWFVDVSSDKMRVVVVLSENVV